MKKLIISAFMAVAALSFVSCQKEVADNTIANDGIDVTIIAGNPITKTVLGADGTTPYWKDGDALSVTDGANSNVEFAENNIADGETSTIATFSGKVSSAGNFYAVYPHSGTVTTDKGPRVTVPTVQYPTATSFDGAADIMVSKQFAVGVTTNTTIENLQFARCGAILKVVFSGKAAAQQTKLADQHPVSVSLTSSDNDLVGNVLFDYENATASISSTPSKSVTASYTTSTQYLINGTNATYLVVVPTKLTGTIDVAATTEDYEIARTLTMPTDGIELEAGKIYTFNVTLGDKSITDATPAQTLPWSNDFSWHTTTSETNYTADVETQSSGEFTAGSYLYGAKEAGAIRIGNGSNPGSITSKLINLSGVFKVTVSAKAYNTSDGSKVTVTVGEVTKTAETALSSTSSYTNYVFKFAAGDGTAKSPIIIGTDKKRAVITSVSVETDIEQVAAPTFSPAAGAVEANTTVTISTETAGATIYYTTDGTDPTTSSTSGSSVTIDAAKTIKAFAVKDGMADSEISTAAYTIVGAAQELPFSESFASSAGTFTIEEKSNPDSVPDIWKNASSSMQATSYYNSGQHASESWLVSPLVDLKSVNSSTHKVEFSFDEKVNKYFNDAVTEATVWIKTKTGSPVQIAYTHPTVGSYGTITLDISEYIGNEIQVIFKYIGSSVSAGTWNVKNVSIAAVALPAHSITVNSTDSPLTVELNGDATKTTKLTVASNYTWSVKSTTGLTTGYTYVKDSDTQITVTPAADNTTGSKKTGIGTMVLTDGTVDYTITFDQANKSEDTNHYYVKVTDLSTLSANDVVLIINPNHDALPAFTGTSIVAATDLHTSYYDSTNDRFSDEDAVNACAVTLIAPTTAVQNKVVFKLKMSNDYYIVKTSTSGTGFNPNTSSTAVSGDWTMTIEDNGKVKILNNLSGSTRCIIWQGGSTNKFGAYAGSNFEATNYSGVDLYKYN